MKKVNIFAILSLIAIIVGYVVSSFVKGIETIILVNLISAVLAVIFAIIGIVQSKKLEKGKVMSIIILVIGILGTLLFIFLFAIINLVKDPKSTKEICEKVINCKQGDNGVSTCYMDSDSTKILPIKCYDTNLTSNQYE